MQKRTETVPPDQVTIVEFTNGDKCCSATIRAFQSAFGAEAILQVSDDRRRIAMHELRTWGRIRQVVKTVNFFTRVVPTKYWKEEFARPHA